MPYMRLCACASPLPAGGFQWSSALYLFYTLRDIPPEIAQDISHKFQVHPLTPLLVQDDTLTRPLHFAAAWWDRTSLFILIQLTGFQMWRSPS